MRHCSVALLRVRLTDEGVVILFKRAVAVASFNGFAPFPVIDINGQALAGIPVSATILTPSTIDKKFVLVHGAISK